MTSPVEESFSQRVCWRRRSTPSPPSGTAARSPRFSCRAHHGSIAAWRRGEAERLTQERRPDLWRAYAEPHLDPARPERSDAHDAADKRRQTRKTAMNLIAAARSRADRRARQDHSRLPPGRHHPRRLQGDRGHPHPRPELRRRLHRPQQRQRHRRASFTVRKISFGEGVERVFPLYSPNIDAITVVRRGKVRRAKLYYLRDRRGKSARIVEKTNYRAPKSAATTEA